MSRRSPAGRIPGAAPSGGSISVVTKTTTYAATDGDCVLADATSAGFTITLPVPTAGAQVWVKKVDASANVVTVAPHAAEDVDGAASETLSQPYQSRVLVSDGTDWWVV